MANILSRALPTVVGSIAGKAGAGHGLVGAALALVAAHVARRSVPGALIIGGLLVAKFLYDQQREREAAGAEAGAGAPPSPKARSAKAGTRPAPAKARPAAAPAAKG